MGTRTLTNDFIDHFKIESFFQGEKKGGQKMVYFVVRKGLKQVMKLFESGKDERFEREMEIYEKYKSMDGIPKIYLIDEYHGETVVFEEFIEGETLSDITQTYLRDNAKVRTLMKLLFDILSPIWKDGYVHRDLKPDNIIIRPNGKPVILDFGIARDLSAKSITATGFQPHSWPWAAPEQYEGKKDMISYRTDFFSLGVIAFYLFQRSLPFGASSTEISNKFKSGNENFSVDSQCQFQGFLTETMRFKPAYRPRSIEDLINLI